jgi:hypothetical protein
MGIFGRLRGALGLHDDSYYGDLAVDDGWGLVPEVSPASLVEMESQRAAVEEQEDWEAIIRAAKEREVDEEEPPFQEEEPEESDWDALIAQAKSRSVTPPPVLARPSRPMAAVRPPTAPPRRRPAPPPPPQPAARQPAFARSGSIPPERPRVTRPEGFVPVPRPPSRRKHGEEDWEAVIARAKAQANTPPPDPGEEDWEAVIARAKTRAA